MSRNFLSALCKSVSTCVILVALAPFTLAEGLNKIHIAPVDPLKTYKIVPNSGKPGTYEVFIASSDPACSASSTELSKAKLKAPQGSSIQVRETTSQGGCSITALIHIPADAAIGKATLWVVEAEAGVQDKVLGTAEFTITDAVAVGRIPTAQPEVDVMWSVLPKSLVKDNFGNSIADKYYAVEVVIGNNSAYALQIVSVGFQLPLDNQIKGLVARNLRNRLPEGERKSLLPLKSTEPGQKTLSPILPKTSVEMEEMAQTTETKTILPTSSYRITRGSLDARHMFHPRNLILGSITALGPIFTGFVPFFHNVNRAANFSQGINIFSNPLEKGLELVWRDPMPMQRERFDDQVLRDGLLIRNNTQTRTLAFFPKELLKLPTNYESSSEYKAWKDNAREVRERLGEIVIIGDLIQHVNRISLISNAPGSDTAPPIVASVDVNTFDQGQQDTVITLKGTNLQNAQVVVSGTSGINITNKVVDPNGRYVTAEIDVADTVAPGQYTLIVTTPGSSKRDERQITINPKSIVAEKVEYDKPASLEVGTIFDVSIIGMFLHQVEKANVTIAGNPKELTVEKVAPSTDGKTVVVTLKVTDKIDVGKYIISVTDPNKKGAAPKQLPEITIK